MQKINTNIQGCYVLEPRIFEDDRGYFFESFNQQTFHQITGLQTIFVQDNQAKSSRGVVRGLHMQRPPYSQAKLLRVLEGKIIDVAVDARKNSPTYGQHFAIELSDQNQQQLYIPHGCLHGYSVISDTALVMYKCDEYYNKQAEDGVYLYDTDLLIDWKVAESDAIISEKDKLLNSFSEFTPVEL